MYSPTVELILASINPFTNITLYTFKVLMPKSYLAQLNTHRILSKNASSSRAIPTSTVIKRIREKPVIPMSFVQNKKGMWGDSTLNKIEQEKASALWLQAMDNAIDTATLLSKDLNLHKEYVNRLLEPFTEAEVLLSGTQWNNFISLRASHDTQPELQSVAQQIKTIIEDPNTPRQTLKPKQWHLPFITPHEHHLDLSLQQQVSVARCARVSYFLKDDPSQTSSLDKDLALFNLLKSSGHWSPFEHIATPYTHPRLCANFLSWIQLRQTFSSQSHGDTDFSPLSSFLMQSFILE